MVRPGGPHIPSMELISLLDLVDYGPSDPFLSIMSSLSPSSEKYWRDLWLRIYSLKPPISRIKSTYFSIYLSILSDHLGSLVLGRFSSL